jgi:hypothetical protein
MESNPKKFRFRLNLFDGIVLILAVAVGAILLWSAFKPQPASTADDPTASASISTVRYVVRVQKWLEGTSSMIHPGDALVDTIKNYEMGQVVDVTAIPATSMILNQNSRQFELAEVPGFEDILVTVEAPVTTGEDEELLLDGGYTLRVGASVYLRSAGYMASGPVISIEREGQA